MRRGQISNINFFLIITIAIFTLISYFTDQLVIRSEDKLRELNIKYNNTKTQINRLSSTAEALSSIAMRGEVILKHQLVKRHIWIKGLILIEDNFNLLGDKKDVNLSNDENLNYKRNLKLNIVENFRDTVIASDSIRDEFQALMLWLDGSVQDDIDKIEGNLKWHDLFWFNKVYKSNKGEFSAKNEKLFDEVYSALSQDNGNEILVNKFEQKHWLDLNRYTILCLEQLHKDLKHVDTFYYKYFEKLIEEYEAILNTALIDLKKISAKKNNYILFSILTQILALLFLLFLFRNMIKSR